MLWLWLLACSPTVYDDTDTAGAPDDVTGADWSALDALFDSYVDGAPEDGMTLVLFGADGEAFYRRTHGGFEPDVRIPVASASKWVSALTLLRLEYQGVLARTATTGEVLGWSEDADITVDHLGAFTSGIVESRLCSYSASTTLQDCVAKYEGDASYAPGAAYEYGSQHLAIAGAMAEVATGQGFNDLFQQVLAQPLGLDDPELRYYAQPKQQEGADNPLLAGGLSITVEEYQRMLMLVLAGGAWEGTQLLETDRLFVNDYTGAVVVDSAAQDLGLDYYYGFGTWLECGGPSASCDVISSAGSYGFVPWVDRERGYAGILGMEGDAGNAAWSVPIQQAARPIIEGVLDAR